MKHAQGGLEDIILLFLGIIFAGVIGTVLVGMFGQSTCSSYIQEGDTCRNQLSTANDVINQLRQQLNITQENYLLLLRENITKQDIWDIMVMLNATNTEARYTRNEINILNNNTLNLYTKIVNERRNLYILNVSLVLMFTLEVAFALFGKEFVSKRVANLIKKLWHKIREWWNNRGNTKDAAQP